MVTAQANSTLPTDIRIAGVETAFETHHYRAPIKFGGKVVVSAVVLNVTCEVMTKAGKAARGFGSMPLGNIWAYPTAKVEPETTLQAMVTLSARCAALCRAHTAFGHPIDLGLQLEEQFLAAADALSREMALADPIPKLATLVTGSPFDAALHDAFGKVHGSSCYHLYDRTFLPRDLGAYLGADYRGKWLADYVLREPVPRLPLYHLVGALDPLTDADVRQPIGDGYPETLPQWIAYNGLTHFKVKLNGDDLGWDLERVVAVDRIVRECRGPAAADTAYSLDFNERCKSVDYLVELLRRLKERTPAGFNQVQYVEQPTARDLRAHPENRMHEAAKLRPVVIDESLTDLDSLLLAREMGYTGAALKACKGQGQSLLMAAAAQNLGMYLCVQDLTCPGASLIQSASLAAHVPGVAAIESNSRQYMPAANLPWVSRFPGIFAVRDGSMDTSGLNGLGLGAV